MKNLIYLFILMGCVLPRTYAQDVITTTSAETIPARILEVRADSIFYKRFYQQLGATLRISKNDVSSVKYEQDTASTAKLHIPTVLDSLPPDHDYYKHGRKDAGKYYHGGGAALRGTVFATLVSPIGGLIPAIATSATPPKEKNLNYPDSMLMKQKDYRYGYSKKAHQLKSNRVWGGFAFGMFINVIALFVFGTIKV